MITNMADKILELKAEGIIDAGDLADQLIQWIGWGNDKELNQFFRNHHPDLWHDLNEQENKNDSE